MIKEYYNKIIANLIQLKDSHGYLIIRDGYFDASRGDEVFCQFIKLNDDVLIKLECISHYFDKQINPDLEIKFKALGFNLEKNGNYFKYIVLNTESDIEKTASELVTIFEALYQVPKENIYDFKFRIEDVESDSLQKKKRNYPVLNKQKLDDDPDTPWIKGFLIVLSIIIGIILFNNVFNSNDERISREKVTNSSWNSSVSQVVDYLKKHLDDADSYQSVQWWPVQTMGFSETEGEIRYYVRHKYRAKNRFGAYVLADQVFALDYYGNVISIHDYKTQDYPLFR